VLQLWAERMMDGTYSWADMRAHAGTDLYNDLYCSHSIFFELHWFYLLWIDVLILSTSKQYSKSQLETVSIAEPLQNRGYWTEIHQIFVRCSQIMAAVSAPIGIAIFQSVLGSRCNE